MSGQLLKFINSSGGFKNFFQARNNLVGYQQNATLKHVAAAKLKDLNLPEKPKRPLTPYFRFMRDCRDEFSRKNPTLKLTEMTKRLAEDWQNVHSTIKEKYNNEFKNEMEVYTKAHLKYLSALSEEQKEAIKDASKEKQEIKKKRNLKKRFKELNRPKRPLGPYMQYLLEISRKNNINMIEVIQTVKGKWQLLSNSEKQIYITRYEEAKERYNKEMAEWEAKMISEGNEDVVRHMSLKENKPSRLRNKDKDE